MSLPPSVFLPEKHENSGSSNRSRLTGPRIFDLWAAWRTAPGKGRPLSADSVTQYETVWRTWLRFLEVHRTAWHAAGPAEIHAFLDHMQPRARVRGISSPSHVSRARYLRSLRAIYGHAVLQGWMEANPAERAPEGARREDADSFVLSPRYRAALRSHLPEGQSWLAVRDRALLHLLMDGGLTVAEVRALQLHQLRLRSGARAELRLDGPRAAQHRQVPLPSPAVIALRHWLVLRGEPGPQELVFVSRKGHAMLSARAVFHVVSQFVVRTLRACGEPGAIAHVGPNVLRNAALAQWLDDGLEAGEVARRAGLDSPRTLLRLAPHCQAAGRASFQEAAAASQSPAPRPRPQEGPR